MEKAVDSLGSVTIDNLRAFPSGKLLFEAASINLNGKQVLQFSRERHAFAEGNFERDCDQMSVLTGIINKATSPAIITGYSGFLDAIGDTIKTNLSENEPKSLINMQLDDMANWDIRQVSVAENEAMPGLQPTESLQTSSILSWIASMKYVISSIAL